MTPKHSEADRLLHVLWTRAVGTPDYVKADWTALQQAINALGRADERQGDRRR